jgi:hypothetical protein
MYKAGSRPKSRPFGPRTARPATRGRTGLRRIPWPTLSLIAVGGVIGAPARQGLWVAFPHRAGAFDWTTLGINVAGCCLLRALMVAITEVRHALRLTAQFQGWACSVGRSARPAQVFASAAFGPWPSGVVLAAGQAWPAARFTPPAGCVTGWPEAITGGACHDRDGGAPHPQRRRSRWRRAR